MVKLSVNTSVVAEPEKVEHGKESSFHVGHYVAPFFSRPWHYHKEYELLAIEKGFGTRMVGDSIDSFKEGDVVLIGANLPHVWISDSKYRKGETEECESYYIQFKKSVFGTHFIDIPELEGIRDILRKADRGIKLRGETAEYIAKGLKTLGNHSSFEQLLWLMNALQVIFDGEYALLASNDFQQTQVMFKNEKMNRIHQYVTRHFKEELKIEDCAKLIGVTPTSLCRIMKKHADVTFSWYLNYIRIDFAQKLLLNTNLSIKEVCFESGYTSIAYFNQQFLKLTGMSPTAYRKKYI